MTLAPYVFGYFLIAVVLAWCAGRFTVWEDDATMLAVAVWPITIAICLACTLLFVPVVLLKLAFEFGRSYD